MYHFLTRGLCRCLVSARHLITAAEALSALDDAREAGILWQKWGPYLSELRDEIAAGQAYLQDVQAEATAVEDRIASLKAA